MTSAAVRIGRAELDKLVKELLASGTRVFGPVRAKNLAHDVVEYAPLESSKGVVLDGPPPVRSAKEIFFPPTEPLLCWRQRKTAVELDEVPTSFAPTVLLGSRPCDAAALDILDRVMGWDYKDELWFGRREATTVVSVACSGEDPACFCCAVGLSPSSTRGADALLVPIGDNGFELRPVTPKGEALVQRHPKCFARESNRAPLAEELSAKAVERVKGHLGLELAALRGWVEGHFDDPYWTRVSIRCHGCGACAAVCPTCHCFDIVDEPDGVDGGTRRRNWDTCQTALFTRHASGHNPRRDQAARIRQRVSHKFAIYPKKFGEILCTGCGRCVRGCPAGMDLGEILGDISRMGAAPASAQPGGKP